MINFSIVIPLFNEGKNIYNLINEIFSTLNNNDLFKFEIILVNDGSTDNTIKILGEIKLTFQNIKVINNKSNLGQSESLRIGISNSSNEVIVTIDGDGQNNPRDIPKLITKFFSEENIKLVGGLRLKRKDSFSKKIASKLANKIRMKILKDECRDTGCSLKVFDKNIFLNFNFFSGIHRFLPALYKGFGYKTVFLEVDHRKRNFGLSKYGNFSRLVRGIIDLIRVYYVINNKKNK